MAIIYNKSEHENSYRRRSAHKYFAIAPCYRALMPHEVREGKQLEEKDWRMEPIECLVSGENEEHALTQFIQAKPDYGLGWRNIPGESQRVLVVIPVKALSYWRPNYTHYTYTRQIGGREVELLDSSLDVL